jgi:type IV pilus assembly protein PilE
MLINKKAFTLIELLVIVLIIGILAAIALPQYRLAVEKSRLYSMLPIMRSIADAKQRYTLYTGNYTGDDDLLDINFHYKTKTCDTNNCRYEFEDGFYCHVRNYETFMPLVCSDRGRYVIDYYYPKQSLCYARIGSAGEKICQSLGNKRPSCSDGNSCYNFL